MRGYIKGRLGYEALKLLIKGTYFMFMGIIILPYYFAKFMLWLMYFTYKYTIIGFKYAILILAESFNYIKNKVKNYRETRGV